VIPHRVITCKRLRVVLGVKGKNEGGNNDKIGIEKHDPKRESKLTLTEHTQPKI